MLPGMPVCLASAARALIRRGMPVFVFLLLASGCPYLPKQTRMAPLSDGVVMTAGVTIVADDGSFELRPHERFQAPFRVAAPARVQGATLSPSERWVGCVLSRLHNVCERHFPSLAQAWPAFEAAGAKRVTVRVSGRSQYHGLLYLGDAPPNTVGSSGKHYKIEIPFGALAQAMDSPQAIVGEGVSPGTGRVRTWILWVSWQPLRSP